MKRRCAAGFTALALLVCAVAWGRLGREVTLSRESFAMNTLISLSVTGGEEQARSALDEAFACLERLDGELSLYDEGSVLSEIGRRAGEKEPLSVPAGVFAAVAKAQEMCRLTDGVFNPLIGPVTKLWKINRSPDSPESFTLPGQASLDAALVLSDPGGLELQPDGEGGGRVRLARRGAALDLGGIAKGYASTRLVELLRTRGISSALLNLGGNIHVLGTKGSAPWNIGIRNPLLSANEPIALVVEVNDAERRGMAVVTSGGYERYRIVNGVRYSHFFDPRTGMPVQNDLLSATLISPDGALADALATAFMVMGSERARAFLAAHSELEAILIRRSAAGGLDILATKNLRGRIRRALGPVGDVSDEAI
ncbi:MAG: FAD:protein FMN transferase [Fretibacterium sp.]|nr:FAD:protein FMN transferase [Fretibacterium sp.]